MSSLRTSILCSAAATTTNATYFSTTSGHPVYNFPFLSLFKVLTNLTEGLLELACEWPTLVKRALSLTLIRVCFEKSEIGARRTRERGRSAGQCEMVKIIIITSSSNSSNLLVVGSHAANAIIDPSWRKEKAWELPMTDRLSVAATKAMTTTTGIKEKNAEKKKKREKEKEKRRQLELKLQKKMFLPSSLTLVASDLVRAKTTVWARELMGEKRRAMTNYCPAFALYLRILYQLALFELR